MVVIAHHSGPIPNYIITPHLNKILIDWGKKNHINMEIRDFANCKLSMVSAKKYSDYLFELYTRARVSLILDAFSYLLRFRRKLVD